MDDRHYQGRHGMAEPIGGAPALPGFTRMSEAEAYNLNLFVAPERLQRSRRMLAAGLFRLDPNEDRGPSNDNRA